jgi:3-oxoacyl-[acyl-carrier-protein] synthase-1/3-oxoacyl-[acyl-carrier-protein] synthase II
MGNGILQTTETLEKGRTGIRPLTLFSTSSQPPLPVGEFSGLFENNPLPRTHRLARLAADQTMAGCDTAPDAVVLGVTTGGMLSTEIQLKKKACDPQLFRRHAPGSVAKDIARRCGCTGPVLTVSTACSSGAVAIKIALQMLRTGTAVRVLAGGADCLCRLTYYGFHSLQLIDPAGARPLDKNRRGISVAEGAAMLLLTANDGHGAVARLLGAGLSCDAHHPVKPHPHGKGALAAMQAALNDAAISAGDIDYINLHGTGTIDNDLAEARAIRTLFPHHRPLVSSIKGACGHSLAAAGAIDAVISSISVHEQLVPANTGCRRPDPELKLDPVMRPCRKPVKTVLSNSFGFGGNNAALIIGAADANHPGRAKTAVTPLSIQGCACVTGAGHTGQTMKYIATGKTCGGILSTEKISENLAARQVRRLKRFSRLALSLALAAVDNAPVAQRPTAVFLGTGWGAQSETFDFLTRLYETDEQFPSPTDFVGSVHNAAAGQVALQFRATGANITMTGGDYSFEQALVAAGLLSGDIDGSFLLIGADEGHRVLSRLFDRSVAADACLSDGGGALRITRGPDPTCMSITAPFFENAAANPAVVSALVERLGGAHRINASFGAVLAGIPAAGRREGQRQFKDFLALTGFGKPVIDYRKITGQFASASAVAAVLAVKFLENGKIPTAPGNADTVELNPAKILLLGLGDFVTAVEVGAP